MHFAAVGLSDQGLCRKRNEDSLCVEESLGLFVVADGMGGHAAGDVASQMAVDVVRNHITKAAGGSEPFVGGYDTSVSENANRIASAARQANQVLHEAAQGNVAWRGMGTTLEAALLDGDRLALAHIGDSRAYLIRGRELLRITEDHTLLSEQVREGLLSQEEAERSSAKNFVTRAVGQHPQVDVDLYEVGLRDQDLVLLCSDGLTGLVSDDALLSIVASVDDPKAACKMLVDAANRNGGRDNISVILIRFYANKLSAQIDKVRNWLGR